MKIISNTTQFHIDDKTAVAIGKFDGIHLGHIELINHILDYAKKNESRGVKTAVFTFDMSAASFFGGKDIKEVTTLSEKRVIFENLGIDYLVEFPLNDNVARTSPENFVIDILLGMMNMEYIAAGDDISFGYKGQGNSKLILDMSSIYNFKVDIIDKIMYEGREISSTFLREEIMNGNMEKVTDLLGHPYSFLGTVEKGFKLGRKLGFPTMNLYPDEEKILPPFGVYFSKVKYDGASYPGITNIGIRPTVASPSDEHISVETYIFDFDKDMYGKTIETELLSFRRKEKRFEDAMGLKKQVESDIEEGKRYFCCL